jgi:anti-sigma factor RsiW
MCGFHDRIFDYLSGNLPPQEREAFEKHLAQCSSCGQAIAQERELSGVLKTWEIPAMESATVPGWKERLSLKQRTGALQPWFGWGRLIYLPAACMVLILFGFMVWTSLNAGRNPARLSAEYEMIDQFEVIQWMDMLENWEEIQQMSPAPREVS